MDQPPSYDQAQARSHDGQARGEGVDESGVDINIDGNAAPPGYETLGFTDTSVPPPPYTSVVQPDASLRQFTPINLSEDEVREALLSFVQDHRCHSNRAAREMNINNILPSSALHYELLTFTESRTTKFMRIPFNGEEVDGPSNGTPPNAWDVSCSPRKLFEPDVHFVEIPHTATVGKCHRCNGSGEMKCVRCSGTGMFKCTLCGGRGTKSQFNSSLKEWAPAKCYSCDGSGRSSCTNCFERGKLTCATCWGAGKITKFVQMTVTYKVHKNNCVVEHSDFPSEYIQGIEGMTIFEETKDMVLPIVTYPDEELVENSKRLVSLHANNAEDNMRKIVKQRHQIKAVPVSEVHWTWQSKGSRFWVYGQQRYVYSPKYPHKRFKGCVIS
ncbi:protein SSUH2 homolog [Glandiceps talaboti]